MTSYRTLLLAGAVVLGATSAYAGDGFEGTAVRDGMGVHHTAPRAHLLERRASQGTLAPYALGRAASRDPRAYDYEPGSTWSRVPIQLQKRDITTEGNGNKVMETKGRPSGRPLVVGRPWLLKGYVSASHAAVSVLDRISCIRRRSPKVLRHKPRCNLNSCVLNRIFGLVRPYPIVLPT